MHWECCWGFWEWTAFSHWVAANVYIYKVPLLSLSLSPTVTMSVLALCRGAAAPPSKHTFPSSPRPLHAVSISPALIACSAPSPSPSSAPPPACSQLWTLCYSSVEVGNSSEASLFTDISISWRYYTCLWATDLVMTYDFKVLWYLLKWSMEITLIFPFRRIGLLWIAVCRTFRCGRILFFKTSSLILEGTQDHSQTMTYMIYISYSSCRLTNSWC